MPIEWGEPGELGKSQEPIKDPSRLRAGRGEPIILGPADWAEVKRIAGEIIQLIPATARHARLEHDIQHVLAREISSANQDYETTLAAEETHTWKFGQHHISECRIDWCGRYSGQRKEEPPPALAGPAAYCVRCARSGVGACDDFPNCPGGRA